MTLTSMVGSVFLILYRLFFLSPLLRSICCIFQIYVYNFADLKLLDHIETAPNSKGLCALCPYSSNTVLVCPGLQKGQLKQQTPQQTADNYTRKIIKKVPRGTMQSTIHDCPLVFLPLSVSISASLSLCLSCVFFVFGLFFRNRTCSC